MSLQWADFPSNQPGLYADDRDYMLDGTPWVALQAGDIEADPDPSCPDGFVLRHNSASGGPGEAIRLAVTTPDTTMGVAMRLWIDGLPTGTRSFLSLNTTGNVAKYGLRCQPNGGIQIVRGAATVIATADYPLLLGNSARHVEFLADVVSGELEVRIQGVPIAELTLTDGSPPGGTIGIVAFPNGSPGSGGYNGFLSKDHVIYNGDGSTFNDFQGTVSVTDLLPAADVSLGDWTTSSGATGYNLLDESPPDTADYIAATDTATTPAEFTFTSLPADTTSVRGLISIVYAAKTDGGDGQLQTGLTPNGVDYDNGADRAITSTGTFWYDVSEVSPDTATAWTPIEVNDIEMRIDRTL